MDTMSREVPSFHWRRMFSDARRKMWAASECDDMPDFGGYLPCEVWAWLGVDASDRPVSVVGPAVRQHSPSRYVGAVWRASIRRDIPGRYPRLNIP